MKLSLTIAIPTLNEERHIKDCINSIGTDFAENIFLIDSNSTDKTCEIAKERGVEVINFDSSDFIPNIPFERRWPLWDTPFILPFCIFLNFCLFGDNIIYLLLCLLFLFFPEFELRPTSGDSSLLP